MAFERGKSGNPGGRPKGSKNKASEGLRGLISDFLEKQFAQIMEDFANLDPKDRVKVFTDLLQYSVPKLQAVSNSIPFEKLTDEQLDEIINRLKNSHE